MSLTSFSNQPPAYVLRAVAEAAEDVDAEPNDQMPQAVPLDPVGLAARGRIAANGDVDRYRFEVTGAMAAGLVEVELSWPTRQELQLCVTSEVGSTLQCAGARDGVTLGRLDLAPGWYGAQVSGNASPDTRYDVRVGPDPCHVRPTWSRSPTTRIDAADAWDASHVMHGAGRNGDVDVYRVHLEPGVPQLWRLEATGSDLEQLEWRQPDGTHVGSIGVADDGLSATIEDLYLVSGDHLLTVRGGGDYELSMSSLGPPDLGRRARAQRRSPTARPAGHRRHHAPGGCPAGATWTCTASRSSPRSTSSSRRDPPRATVVRSMHREARSTSRSPRRRPPRQGRGTRYRWRDGLRWAAPAGRLRGQRPGDHGLAGAAAAPGPRVCHRLDRG